MKFVRDNPSLGYGIFLTLIAYVMFAICSAFVRVLGEDFPTIEIILFQSIIPFLCLLPIVLSHHISSLKPVAITPHIIRDIGGLLSYFFYFLAIKYLGLIDATVLTYTAPFYIPIICYIWTKEKIHKETLWAIALGFLGVLLILKPGSSIFNPLSIIGILAGIFSAIVLVSISILNKKRELLTNTLFYNFLTATIISLPIAILSWKHPTFIQWALLLGIGLSTFIGQIFLTTAYRHGAAAYLSPMSYSIIIYISMISWIFFKSLPGWLSFVGILFVVIGGTITFVLRKHPPTISQSLKANHIHKKPWWKFWSKAP